MFCHNCGSQISDTSKFCSSCGSLVENTDVQTAPQPAKKKAYADYSKNICNFFSKALETIKHSRKIQIAICSVAVLIGASIVVSSLLAGNIAYYPNHTHKATFKSFITAQKNMDKDALVELSPPPIYDYYYLRYDDYTPTQRDGHARSELGWYQLHIQIEPNIAPEWSTPGYVKKVSYDIHNTYKATPVEVEELNQYILKKLDFSPNFSDAVLYSYSMTFITADGKKVSCDYNPCMLVKINNKWYCLSESQYKFWLSGNYDNAIDYVDWAYYWFKENTEFSFGWSFVH